MIEYDLLITLLLSANPATPNIIGLAKSQRKKVMCKCVSK
jgi:hypothetical protein